MDFRSKRERDAILNGLMPELQHPAGDKAKTSIKARGSSLIFQFEASSSTKLRAIVSSYLRLLTASFHVCENLITLERSSSNNSQKKQAT